MIRTKAFRFASRAAWLAPLFSALACHGGQPPRSATAIPSGPAVGTAAVGFALAETPISLTASDGTGLRLSSVRAKAVIDGPLAFTELHLTFQNPVPRTLEGTFRVTLPEGASLGRFAMKIDEGWQEGEVVELEAARRAYEDFLHRKQDPALMEKAAGNEFSARVFPIPAGSTKEIVLAWASEVSGRDGRYRLPLRGLPTLDTLDVDISVRGSDVKVPPRHERDRAPAEDVVVEVSGRKEAISAVRNEDMAIVQVRPTVDARPEALSSAIVLVDTSASRTLGFDAEVAFVGRLVKRIADEGGTVTVACFDQSVEPIFAGRAADLGPGGLAKIRERGALGASNLERALGWARTTAATTRAKRVVLVTDGVATAGATEPKALVSAVSLLKDSGVERIDAALVGGIRDDVGLLRLVRGNLARDGVVADATRDPSEVVQRLGQSTRSNVAIRIEGATWFWPTRLDGVQPGDASSIYVEIPAGKPLRVVVDGREAGVSPRVVERPLVERAVAQAKVASLLEREASGVQKDDGLRKSIVSLATQQRIMTPYTAMLVLERESDYQQYGIDRRSLSDVLAIEGGVVRRVHRTALALAKAPADSPEVEVLKLALASAEEGNFDKKDSAPRGGAAGPAARSPETVSPRPPPAARAAKPSSRDAPRPAATASAPPPRPVRAAPERDAPSDPRERSVPTQRMNVARPTHAAAADDETETDTDARHVIGKNPYEGKFATVMDLVREKRAPEALRAARAWHVEEPGDVLALVALGEAAEANKMLDLAARAYGSLIDLFSNRADLRRFAGERLERLGSHDGPALDLAIDSFEKAAADRGDHPSSHRLLTFALVRKKDYPRAFASAVRALERGYEVDRFAGVDRILREDVGLVGAAWANAEPGRKEQISAKVRAVGGKVEDQPSTRFVLNWETDANDVDFHIHDAQGGHAFYNRPHLRSGGDLYADVTTGYGPECFTIRGPKSKTSRPYKLEAHYFSRGPMGYGMGKLEVIEHDGRGNLTFDERPFVVMVDQAFVDLGEVR